MHYDFPLLTTIAIALAIALLGGFIARKLSFPSMVGYLLAGVIIGPFTPGYVGDSTTIKQLAELGVMFLMFGVGLHFSLRDLWTVRRIAVPGALLQIAVITLLTVLVASLWGWSSATGLLLGLAISIASTVVLLRNLMDRGLLNTSIGQAAVGWLVLEDLITVAILVLLPALATPSAEPWWQAAGIALLKAGGFALLMIFVGPRVIPALLNRLAHLRSRELFTVAIIVIAIGIALSAATFFGVSLALGAFLAGVVVSESHLSHQVEAEILPFRETFTVLFFVSVGMLVNPLHLLGAIGPVLAFTAIIILGKWVVTFLTGVLLAWPARTTLMMAAGRSQIGEFSFILGETGVALGLLSQEQYSVLLAGAIISITINPFLFRISPWLETRIQNISWLRSRFNQSTYVQPEPPPKLTDHVIVVGYGRVGSHIIRVLGHLETPRLVIDFDVERIAQLQEKQIPTLYGDAANSEILLTAQLRQARVAVVTIPDETAAQIITATMRDLAPDLPIIVRAATQEGIQQLLTHGATSVIQPELEGGLGIVQQTLTRLNYPDDYIQTYLAAVRHDRYDTTNISADEEEALGRLQTCSSNGESPVSLTDLKSDSSEQAQDKVNMQHQVK